jgi:hypothetical protein
MPCHFPRTILPLIGLRDLALIATMIYSFARVSAMRGRLLKIRRIHSNVPCDGFGTIINYDAFIEQQS